MTSFVTEAIVTGAIRYGEADRILTLLTPERGRFGAIAKSARKAKSSFQGAAEPFIHARFELAEGRSLAIVRHAEVLDALLGIRESWSRLQLAGHVAEIANKMGEEKHPDPELYDLTLEALKRLNEGRVDAVLRFKAGLLDHMGVFPELGACVGCGTTKVRGQVHLDEPGGGFLCGDCAKAHGVFHPVAMGVLHVLHALRTGQDLPADADDSTLDAAEDLLTSLLQAFLQAGFKTVPAARQARVAEREHRKVEADIEDSNSEGAES